MIKNISNLGDAAVYCDFGKDVNEKINSKVISYFNSLKELVKENKIEGITNLTPSYNKLIISFDLSKTNFRKIKKALEALKVVNNQQKSFKKIKIPICCNEEFALDLIPLSKKINIPPDEIIDLHLNKEYFCYMTGFIAGMPFLGDIDEKIRFDRLKTPRIKVPKGSIGITEQFCNIYTFESPGGWNIIGNTPINIFDKTKENKPNLINPGDTIIFNQISRTQYEKYND